MPTPAGCQLVVSSTMLHSTPACESAIAAVRPAGPPPTTRALTPPPALPRPSLCPQSGRAVAVHGEDVRQLGGVHPAVAAHGADAKALAVAARHLHALGEALDAVGVVDDPEVHVHVLAVELRQRREELGLWVLERGHLDVVHAAVDTRDRLASHAHAEPEVGHVLHGP